MPIEVRFRDLDSFGHVNNAVYLTYFESARLAWWATVVGTPALSAVPFILARAEVDYRAPANLGMTLEVTARCLSLGRSSFVMGFEAREQGSGRLLAEARKVLVHYDYATLKSSPLPDHLRAAIRAADPDVEEKTG